MRRSVLQRYRQRRPRYTARIAAVAALLVLVSMLAYGVATLGAGGQTAGAHARNGVHSVHVSGEALPFQVYTTPTPITPPQLLPAPPLAAHVAYLLDPDRGTLYLATNPNAEVPMASTTKIMTALVALSVGTLDMPITVGADAAAINDGTSSVAGLRTGEVLTLHDMLYALMLPSGDDAAIAIADGVAGSQERFVGLMNAEAALLGLWHTHYADVHGLDIVQHYTSARDLVTLTRVALRSPTFSQIVATPSYVLPATNSHAAYEWHNTNRLLTDRPYEGVTGVKTGFTGDAGRCLVFSATRPSGRLLGVLLGEPTDADRFADARALLDWGFALEADDAGH